MNQVMLLSRRTGAAAHAHVNAARLALLLPLLGGCYRYTPVELHALRPGEHVRAHLTAVEADRLAPTLGGAVARRFDGVLVQTDSTAVLLQIPSGRRTTASGIIEQLNQQVTLGRESVLRVELRQLDRTRTGALVALGAVTVGVVVGAWVSAPRDSGPGEFEVPEARRRFTLVRVPW